MIPFKKKRTAISSALVLLALFLPHDLDAQLVVSEIMYDLEVGSDAGREWVEIFNGGTSPVTLSDWRLFEGSTNHTLVSFEGGETLGSGQYAVIADNPEKFLEDWPAFSGALFDSTFSLNNTGEILILRCCRDELSDRDTVTYSAEWGAQGDGQSLHRAISGIFSPGAPTPGKGTLATQGGGSGVEEQDPEDTEESQSVQSGVTTTGGSGLRAHAGSNRTVTVGIDERFEAAAYDEKGQKIQDVHYRWNFGDGRVAQGQFALHRFVYAGRYAVTLEATRYGVSSTHRITVTAESADITLSALDDGGITIANNSNRDVNLSGWVCVGSNGQRFLFPDHTILLRGGDMLLSPMTLGFHAAPGVELRYPNGTTAARIEETVTTAPVSTTTLPQVPEVSILEPEFESARSIEVYAEVEDSMAFVEYEDSPKEVEDFSGTSSLQVAAAASGANRSYSTWWLPILAIGTALLAVYALRHRRRSGWNIIEERE